VAQLDAALDVLAMTGATKARVTRRGAASSQLAGRVGDGLAQQLRDDVGSRSVARRTRMQLRPTDAFGRRGA
jgi:hypothetical protein